MKEPGFIGWFAQEIDAAQEKLLATIEQADKLRYVDAPRLHREYMEKIGTAEEPVLEAELDARMLQRKLELIQSKRNRREPVNLQEIDRQLEQERQALLEKINAAGAELTRQPELTDEEQKELQASYNKIVENFHPKTRPNLTDTEKALYEKAVEAYKHQNLAAMKLIEQILFKNTNGIGISFSVDVTLSTEKDWEAVAESWEKVLSNDYTLAKRLYPFFVPKEQETMLRNATQRFTTMRTELEQQIEELLQVFPFSAAATLADPEKTQAYLDSLRLRKLRAEDEKTSLNRKIAQLTEELNYAGR